MPAIIGTAATVPSKLTWQGVAVLWGIQFLVAGILISTVLYFTT